MRAGDPFRRGLLAALLAAPLLAGWPCAWGIDNPDVPDLVADFHARARPLEDRWSAAAGGPGEGPASQAYLQFLDQELNQAYRALMTRLPAASRRALVRSQQHWLAYRDAEVRFIDANWTAGSFGTSASISRADYQASLVRQRVLTLLSYLKNYPAN